MLPHYPGSHRTPGTPGVGHPRHALRRDVPPQALDPADRLRQRDVSRGPDVGAPQRHQEIDFGRPGPHTFEPRQRPGGRRVVQARNRPQVESSRAQRLGQVQAVRRLLPRHAERSQVAFPQLDETGGSERHHPLRQTAEHGPGRGQGHLLLQDDAHECREARPPPPERRWAMGHEEAPQVGIPPGQVARRPLQVQRVQRRDPRSCPVHRPRHVVSSVPGTVRRRAFIVVGTTGTGPA
jgi:hypothetical protein